MFNICFSRVNSVVRFFEHETLRSSIGAMCQFATKTHRSVDDCFIHFGSLQHTKKLPGPTRRE